MKRDIEWVEKLEDRVKRKVRIKFPGNGQVKWQFKRSDEEEWDYKSKPTDEDWANLEEKIDALYHRRRAPYKDLQLVQQLRREAAREN
ncbi:MAG: hypothetical protein JXR25_17545 [Pontiellaceae bacterium]|nr:hypothetical protein [Pontiellaceae bacterium]MBN2786625.1 hypothetical protein [Pontiellaceae bacterium]